MKTATKHCPNNSATVEELCFVLCQSLYPYCRFAKLRERSPGFSGHCTIGQGLKFLGVWFFPVLVIPWHFRTIGVFLIRVVRRSSNGPTYLFSGYADFIVCNVITVWDAQDQMIFDFLSQSCCEGRDLQEYKKNGLHWNVKYVIFNCTSVAHSVLSVDKRSIASRWSWIPGKTGWLGDGEEEV